MKISKLPPRKLKGYKKVCHLANQEQWKAQNPRPERVRFREEEGCRMAVLKAA